MTGPDRGPLLGRAAEFGVMGQLVANVRSGQSAVLVGRGEPGIGKTALLHHLAGQAQGFKVARAVGSRRELDEALRRRPQARVRARDLTGATGGPAARSW